MNVTYDGKPLIPTKRAYFEMREINLDLNEVIDIFNAGFDIKKRKGNVIEKGIIKKDKVINVVAVDMDHYYKLIHVGKFTLTRKFRRLMQK